MDLSNEILQVSTKLNQLLETIPSGEDRTSFISEINQLLDERGELVEKLKNESFQYDESNNVHVTLLELDKSIRKRLDTVFDAVKTDIMNLNNSKKHEMQYINPYASVQVMDGRYYDKRK